MSNPFERDDLRYSVLVNDEGQHSLWSELVHIPAGWRAVLGPATREACIDHVDRAWTDIRPTSPGTA